MVSKTVKVYPYRIILQSNESIGFNPQEVRDAIKFFQETFDIKRLDENVIKFEDIPHLLVIDEVKHNFLFGKFMKLRKTAPLILDRNEKQDFPFPLLEHQCLEEISHFIWNLKDEMMFSEYNYWAMRNFAKFEHYINQMCLKHLKINDIAQVVPLMNLKAFENFKKDNQDIKTIQIGAIEPSMDKKERSYWSPRDTWKGLAHDKRFYYNINFSRYYGKDVFDKNEFVRIFDHLKNDPNIKTVKVRTLDAVYELIGDNLEWYTVECDTDTDGKTVDKYQFYDKVETLYLEKIKEIKNSYTS